MSATATAKQTQQSAETKTPQSGAPKYAQPRPWLAMVDGNGRSALGKDGVTPDGIPWMFDTDSGVYRIADVVMTAVQDKQTGQYSRPKPTGMIRAGDLPAFEFAEVQRIYDTAEKEGISLRVATLRAVNKDSVTRDQLRKLATARDVYVAKDVRFAVAKQSTEAADAEIARVLGENAG